MPEEFSDPATTMLFYLITQDIFFIAIEVMTMEQKPRKKADRNAGFREALIKLSLVREKLNEFRHI